VADVVGVGGADRLHRRFRIVSCIYM
jgi:hypothetical protein